MLFILYRFGKFLALHIPLAAAYGIAGFIASAYSFFSKKDRAAVKGNLKVIFPDYDDDKISGMATEVFVNFGKYLVDFFRFSKIDEEYIQKHIKIEGVENLKGALAENKGVIILSAHLGNWELGAATLSLSGYNFAAVVLEHKDKQVNRFFIRQRELKKVEVISPVGAALRRCFSVLRENRLLALVGDRDYFDNGVEVDFFGRPTLIPKGPALFGRRCLSPIVPTFMIRNSGDTFTLKLCKSIRVIATRDERKDLVMATEAIAHILENIIREYPTQWCVFRRFWERIGWKKT